MTVEGRVAGVLMMVAALAAMSVVGCGGGSSSDASEPEAGKTFLVPGSKNKIPKFGEEADEEEREAASEVLEENLQARAAADFETQCSSLTPEAVKEVENEAALRNPGPGCEKNLTVLAEPLPETQKIRANTMTGPIDALRIKGDQAWALYHGAKGKDYAMKMVKEDDEWKVDNVATVELS